MRKLDGKQIRIILVTRDGDARGDFSPRKI